MDERLSVLVTGCSSGIGQQAAETLARHGYTVFATMRDTRGKNRGAADELTSFAEREGVALEVLELDVTDEQSVQQAVQAVLERAGKIDVLVNNAALGMMGISEACTIEQLQSIFDVNVFGVMRVNQAVLPVMRERRSGLIIYTSSATSHLIYPFLGLYGATKAALEAMVEAMHYELFSLGIDTVILQLGGYATSWGTNVQFLESPALQEAYGPVGQVAGMASRSLASAIATFAPPQLVAEHLAELIALPAGQRPLKLPLGFSSEGLEVINEAQAPLQHDFLQLLGFGGLLVREQDQSYPVPQPDSLAVA